jgi:hypothetical protein
MTRRRLGYEAVRNLAASRSLEHAVAMLLRSPYSHDAREGQTLEQTQRAVADTLLWNVRVLAGWAPAEGVTMLRALASPLVVVNVDEHLRRLSGSPQPPPYRLGALSTAWPRLAETGSVSEIRQVLSTSRWGDPGGETPREIVLSMRTAVADRVIASAPGGACWAVAATALLIAREVIRDGRELPGKARSIASNVVGAAAVSATTLSELAGALPPSCRWVFADITSTDDLWRAEARWWHRVERDAFTLALAGLAGPDALLGSVALLAVDAWRVRAALQLAVRGGAPLEAFDAVA